MKLFVLRFAFTVSVLVVLLAPRAGRAVDLPPTLKLLGAGVQWSAQKTGGTALYVNWQDNLYLHPNPWGPPYSSPNPGDIISYTLKRYGFRVTFAGEIPSDLSAYDVVVITAYWACEPSNASIIKEYIANGGGAVLVSGVPAYFANYCKHWWPGGNIYPIRDWFGAQLYIDTGGYARVKVNNPFGTTLSIGDSLGFYPGYSNSAITALLPGTEVIAQWDTGYVFSSTYGYGNGRLYFQASYEDIPVPNYDPVANAGSDQTIETTSCAGASVILDGSASSDPDNDPLTYTWTENGSVISTDVNPTVTLSYGSHDITLTVDDGKGGTATDDVKIDVVDTTAPALNVSLNPNVLWPPNHKMVTIMPAVTFSDACNDTTTMALISKTSNEPDNGLGGDGDTANDIVVNSDGTISLRAERSGKGTGRIYTITYQAMDAAGNTTTASATMTVQHNK